MDELCSKKGIKEFAEWFKSVKLNDDLTALFQYLSDNHLA